MPERQDGHAGKTQPVIVMEMNELCPSLLNRWMGDGRLPNFKKLHDRAQVFETDADVVDPVNLEPWIQWYSVHTGLAFEQHGVFNLTDGKRAGHEDIYAALLARGKRVGSFASMNVKPFHSDGSFFVGDPWSEADDAFPAELNVYNRFVSMNVREYSNENKPLDLGDYAAFARFMTRRGLSLRTVFKTIRQLGSEKLVDRDLAFRRVAILDRLQFDVFRHYVLANTPELATFFVNSTAHLQHAFWRHMDPDAFEVRPDSASLKKYGDAVLFGYQAMDSLVGEFTELARMTDARLVFQTALSQQPFLKRETTGGQHFYRIRDIDAFLEASGIAYADVDPTMTHQYMLTFATSDEREAAMQKLLNWKTGSGKIIFDARRSDAGHIGLYFGCQISEQVDLSMPVSYPGLTNPVPFSEFLYRIDAIKSGCHHPVGALWIEFGNHRVHTSRVSILDTYPTLLEMLGVAAEKGDRRGHSLVPEMLDLALAS